MKRSFVSALFLGFGVLPLACLSAAWGSDEGPQGGPEQQSSGFKVRFESGPVWQSSNSIQIPSPGGTRFQLTDLGTGPGGYLRIDTSMQFGRHAIRALYAPLTLKVGGVLNAPLSYQNVNFSAGASTEGLYTFNSYRLTYRYQLVRGSDFDFWIGFTAKVRDAEIRLIQANLTAARSNVGFVPLLHALIDYRITDFLRLIFEADALAAPQGRAEDLGLILGWKTSKQTELFLGYRTVEGGSDGGGQVYNFTWLHYGVMGFAVNI